MKWLKRLSRLVTNTCVVFSFIIAGMFGADYLGLINFYRPFVVLSGSMEPQIKTGSVVLVQARQFGYMVDDVITFMTSAEGVPTTHRIISLEMKDNQIYYRTQGDANNNPDINLVNPQNVIGRVTLTVPYLGYAASFMSTPQGFVALVIIPATIIIYEELKTIKRELARMLQRLRQHRGTPEEEKKLKPHIDLGKKRFMGLGLLVLVTQIAQPVTHASYTDSAVSVGNYFAAASDYGDTDDPGYTLPPECQHLSGKIDNYIQGTDGNDKLDGTIGNDFIVGLGGRDRIDGSSGDDCIVGGDGRDELDGGSGNDVLLGGADNDEIDGGSGEDYIEAGEGNDEVDGSAAADIIYGGPGNDKLDGGSGDDLIRGQEGNDEIEGGSGVDDIHGDEGDDVIEGDGGDDRLNGGPDFDQLDGGAGTDTCIEGETLKKCEA